MAEKLGIGFVIGATVGSSVAAAFATVDSKLKATREAFNSAARAARITNDALAARGKRDAAISAYKASDGTDKKLRKEMEDAVKEYRKAKTAASAYGRSVDEWRRKHEAASAAVESTNVKLQRLRGIQDERARRQELRGQMVEAVAPLAAVGVPVKLAIDFESSMADAAKTMDGMRDAVGNLTPKYYEMQNIIKGMGRELPLAHTEIARLFAAGGQLGISDVDELKKFSTMAAHMSVAFNMSAEESADAIGKFRTALKMDLADVGSVLDLMNQYANTSSAKEKDIAETLSRIGALGSVAGVSAKPMTALAATLAAVGTAPDVAATAIKNMMLSMVSGTAATKGQREAYSKLGIDVIKLSRQMQKDGPAAILSVLQSIKKLEKHEQAAIMKELFGSESLTAITPFLDNMDMAIKNLELAENTSGYAGAMQKEFANRAKTTANALQLAKNRVTELGINLGSVLLPPINKFLDIIGPAISGFADWASAHEGLTTAVMGAAAGFVGFKVGVMALSYVFSGLRTGILGVQMRVQQFRTGLSTIAGLASKAGAGLRSLGTSSAVAGMQLAASGARMTIVGRMATMASAGLRGLGMAFGVALGPVGILMTALSMGVPLIMEHWDKIAPYFTALWDGVKSIFTAALGWVEPIFQKVGQAWNWLFGDGEEKKTTAAVKPAAAHAALSTSVQSPAPHDGSASRMAALSAPTARTSDVTPGVSLNMQFVLNGIPDGAFAQGVVKALRERSSDLERIVSDIVNNQARLAYGH